MDNKSILLLGRVFFFKITRQSNNNITMLGDKFMTQ